MKQVDFIFCFMRNLSLSLKSSGLYEYKVIGTLDGVSPDVCAKVYVDLKYRKKWDSYVKGRPTSC